jgi:hypothetical protein
LSHLRILIFISILTTAFAHAQLGGRAGAFSRLGFGARGMGMGNALTAVTGGDVVPYYNPALLPLSEYRYVSASMGILTLDRKLNFINYTQALPPNAGIAAGVINSGVSNIDGRDHDGEQTGLLRTSENQFFLGFSVRLKNGLSIGVNLKLYYYHLYTDVSTTTVGVDLGALFPVNESLTLGVTARDINSKYKWDTSTLYGQQGNTTEDKFPQLYTFGIAYRLPDSLALVSADIEFSNMSTFVGRFGAEIPVIPELTFRGGIDRVDLKNKGNGVAPTFGLTIRKNFDSLEPAINYAYVVEPFASTGMHIVSVSVRF